MLTYVLRVESYWLVFMELETNGHVIAAMHNEGPIDVGQWFTGLMFC